MLLTTYVRAAEEQRLSNHELSIIRKQAEEMTKNIHTQATGNVLLRLLNHIMVQDADSAFKEKEIELLQLRLKGAKGL